MVSGGTSPHHAMAEGLLPESRAWSSRLRARLAANGGAAAPTFADVEWTLPFIAYLVYVGTITTYRLPLGNLAMIVGLVGVALQRAPMRFPRLMIWFAAFLFWCAIGYVVTPYPDAVWERLTDYVKLWAVLLVGVNAIRSRAQIRLFIVFSLGCFALYPMRGAFFNYFFYKSSVLGRAIWQNAYSNPNDLAAFALLQVGMVTALLVREPKGWVRRAGFVGIALLPLLVLMTQSRGGFLALFVFAAIALGGQWRQLRRMIGPWGRLRLFVAACAVILAVGFVAPRGVWERVRGLQHATTTERLRDVDREGSARQRYEIWKVASKVFRENPIIGIGAGAYPFAHATYVRGEEFDQTAKGNRDSHSTYLTVLAESGIPGFVAFVGIVLSAVVAAERVRRRCKREAPRLGVPILLLELALLSFLTAGLFGSFAHVSFLYIHLGLLWVTTQATKEELDRPAYAWASSDAPVYERRRDEVGAS